MSTGHTPQASHPGTDSRETREPSKEQNRLASEARNAPGESASPTPAKAPANPLNPSLTGTARGRRSTLPSGTR